MDIAIRMKDGNEFALRWAMKLSLETVKDGFYENTENLSQLFKMCFDAGFIMSGFSERVFELNENSQKFDWYDIPPAIIVRLEKT